MLHDGRLQWRHHLSRKPLRPGDFYKLSMRLGDATPWTFDAKALTLSNGGTMLDAPVPENEISEFANELTTEPNIDLFYNGKLVANLSLADSGAAAAAMLACQKAINGWRGKAADPFATLDPFQSN